MLPDFYPDLVAKIRARLVPDPDRPGCAIWPLGGKKHARLKFAGKLYSPHRVMLEWKLGRVLPRRIDACHACDNPPCCAEAHLWEGTRGDNMRDAIAKGLARPPIRGPEAEARRIASLRAGSRPWTSTPLRRCETLNGHPCEICRQPVALGELYYDRGSSRRSRAHVLCVERGAANDTQAAALPTPARRGAP